MYIYIPGWWFGTFFIFHILGIYISQLTFIFFMGVETTHHIYIYIDVIAIGGDPSPNDFPSSKGYVFPRRHCKTVNGVSIYRQRPGA